MKFKKNARWITAGICFAIYAAWALIVARLAMYQGDRMIGFHPVIFTIIPGVIVGAISAFILLVCRQWQIGTALGFGSLILFLVFCKGRKIEEWAWQRTIALNSQANERATASIHSDLEGDSVSALWETDKLSRLEGFKWYGRNHLSAPDGVYFGFRIGGVPHIRIQKIRHGWRGIALVHSKSDITTLTARTGLTYSRVGSSDWYKWSTDP